MKRMTHKQWDVVRGILNEHVKICFGDKAWFERPFPDLTEGYGLRGYGKLENYEIVQYAPKGFVILYYASEFNQCLRSIGYEKLSYIVELMMDGISDLVGEGFQMSKEVYEKLKQIDNELTEEA